RDILRHYVDNILPDGFKAQVVAVSRTAAVRYYEALREARSELVERLEKVDPALLHVDGERLARLSPTAQFLVRAHRHLETLRELDFAPVISAGRNDPPGWAEWTDPVQQALRIASFKKPFAHEDREKRAPLAFLIVKSMLLTGFDAPNEGVLYLDRPIRNHELLQAIARVNRTYPRKTAGIVVDYYGVARHLKEALAAYSVEDVQGAMQSLQEEIPKLRDRHLRVLAVFRDRGIESLEGNDNLAACVELLREERLRAEFHVKLKMFLSTLELVLPRPEALPHVHDAKTLGEIQIRARNRYRTGERLIGKDVGEKVRQLIDDHVVSRGIDPKIPPISILDAEFEQHVAAAGSDRARASEMEHAARYHIRKHFDEDPERYQKLSERLKTILAELHDRWDEQTEALRRFLEELRAGRERDETGLDPETQAPFLGILRQEMGGNGKIDSGLMERLCRITVDLVAHIQQEIRLVGFWSRVPAQEVLRSWIVQRLDEEDLFAYERLGAIADRLVELAKARREKLVR
ncbi:MAG TPA: type I restriction enzyme endonuclease domain-containing protein, partial [Thermoanaerobaculia bacterium]|nr:type I restriction enzyme endonuclease domain-containing protein [Thermoanaerobaculia bacterium]